MKSYNLNSDLVQLLRNKNVKKNKTLKHMKETLKHPGNLKKISLLEEQEEYTKA